MVEKFFRFFRIDFRFFFRFLISSATLFALSAPMKVSGKFLNMDFRPK